MRNAMNYKMICHIIAPLLVIEAIFLLPAIGIGIYYGEINAVLAIVYSQSVMILAAGVLYFCSKRAPVGFHAKEGLVTTGLTWIIMSVLGCLPFYIAREIPRYMDALFEVVSGFTTTGSSILLNVEAMSRCLLYWRSFTHWLGGMGVLVFLLAVLPLTRGYEGFTIHILRAESPGPSVGKIVPRMKETAVILYVIYIGLTVLDIVFLLIGRMPLFDAICIAFGTAGTGGFGVLNDSMAGYTAFAQTVTTTFMLLFGINFTVFYMLLLKRFKSALFDEELRVYLVIVVLAVLGVAWNIRNLYPTLRAVMHQAAFAVATIISTSGFAIANFNRWPAFAKTVLLCLMVCGACAGSTGGGVKVARLLLLGKGLRRNVHVNMHPSQVLCVRLNGNPVNEKTIRNVAAYLVAYMAILVISVLFLSLDGFSLETNLSAVLATINNIGPGLGMVGPAGNYAHFSDLSKLVLIFDMLAGRLEIFPILVLFGRSTWRK